MDKFFSNLARQAEANPIGALIVGSMLMNAATKLIRVHHEGIGSRAYAKDVNRRVKASKP